MIGNAAENSAAVRFARRDRMDLALNIVTQASVQIALFVTPVLVLLSFPLGHPLDLLFSTFEILAVTLAVAIVAYLILNGESNWFEGVQLLALYTMIAVAIYFLQ
jgi:Ca2+:H+ antiporter